MTATPAYARPLDAVERVVRLSRGAIVTERRIAGDEPFFAGHYPGFPIFPGMFQVETAIQASRLYAEEHGLPVRLIEARSRFLSAVRPGDLLACECTCALAEEGTRLRVDATCRTGTTRTATVRLVFAVEDGHA